MKIISLALLFSAFMVLVSCSQESSVEPNPYSQFLGKFEPRNVTEDLAQISVVQTDLGLKVFVNGFEYGYVSVTGNFLGASPTVKDQVDFLMIELTDKGFTYSLTSKKGITKGSLTRI